MNFNFVPKELVQKNTVFKHKYTLHDLGTLTTWDSNTTFNRWDHDKCDRSQQI